MQPSPQGLLSETVLRRQDRGLVSTKAPASLSGLGEPQPAPHPARPGQLSKAGRKGPGRGWGGLAGPRHGRFKRLPPNEKPFFKSQKQRP